jgi:pimeloyl-ACP methyl ester carboxylesterase
MRTFAGLAGLVCLFASVVATTSSEGPLPGPCRQRRSLFEQPPGTAAAGARRAGHRSAVRTGGPQLALAGSRPGAPPAAEDRMIAAHVSGPAGALHVDDGGHGGTPVVFLHAFAGNTEQWTAQLAHLRHARRAVAIDLRGHGLSAAPVNRDYAIPALASDIAAVADQLHLEDVVLVGHGLGGHWPHMDTPEEFNRLLDEFLRRI